jgi:tetratricopeptide (TPR) repeat protein
MKHKFYNIRGTKYANLGQLDIAISYYEKAIDLNPDFTGAQNNLSNAKALK